MSNHAHYRPDALRGARRRSSSSIESDGFLYVLEQLGKTYENLQAGARNKDCAREKMKRELNRLRSFERWPSASQEFRAELASAGLFYVGPKDRVQCFSCGGILKCRVFRASAMQEHRKLIPYCHFVMGREVGNIPKQQPVCGRPDWRCEPQSMDPEASRLSKAARPDMTREWKREYSFSGWPKDKVLPSELARAGFYYVGYDDRVRCFCCSTAISNWKSHHDPWQRHAQHFPRCAFLKQQKGPDFIQAVQEQYCEGPVSPKADQQSTGRSTAPRQGLCSTPAQPPACAPSSQSLVTRPWVDDHLNSPLMQAVLMGNFEQTTQQMLQSALMEDVKLCDSFLSLILPSDQESLDFDMDNAFSEEPVSPNPSTVGASAKLEAAGTPATVQEQLRQLKEERVCKICRDSQVSIVFVPCGHLVVCMGCAPGLNQCPICRASIEDTVHTFMS